MEIVWYDIKNACWNDRLDILYPKYQQYESTHQRKIVTKSSTEHAQKVHKASLPLITTLPFETILTCICNASFSNEQMINRALMVKPLRIPQEYDSSLSFKRLIFREFFFLANINYNDIFNTPWRTKYKNLNRRSHSLKLSSCLLPSLSVKDYENATGFLNKALKFLSLIQSIT